jgi:hypothetical protein
VACGLSTSLFLKLLYRVQPVLWCACHFCPAALLFSLGLLPRASANCTLSLFLPVAGVVGLAMEAGGVTSTTNGFDTFKDSPFM